MAEGFQFQTTIFALSLLVSLSSFINGVVSRNTLYPNGRSVLRENEYLLQNESIVNGANKLYMENSCNLVLYLGNLRTWESDTAGEATKSCWAQLLVNGNFVVFGDNKTLWSSLTARLVGKYVLALRNGEISISPFRASEMEARKVEVHDDLEPIWSLKIVKDARVE